MTALVQTSKIRQYVTQTNRTESIAPLKLEQTNENDTQLQIGY